MKMLTFITGLKTLLLLSCNFSNNTTPQLQKSESPNEITTINDITSNVDESQLTIIDRFPPPKSYLLAKHNEHSYEFYLSHLQLLPINSKVHLYNGELKRNQNAQASIIKMDVGSDDLQQCADAVMRLRAEYLFSEKKHDNIQFNFTNGFNANYVKWRNGFRIKVIGNSCQWIPTTNESTSYESFRAYLKMVFNYAGTLSLSRQLKSVPTLNDIKIGDVFIRGGSPGHAVVVVNVATNSKTGNKLFMIAQSYMPAQEIHILKNDVNPTLSPWYSIADIENELDTPEYTFYKNELMRF
jgi:hypothetical protein